VRGKYIYIIEKAVIGWNWYQKAAEDTLQEQRRNEDVYGTITNVTSGRGHKSYSPFPVDEG
jgi:hypothetical protein